MDRMDLDMSLKQEMRVARASLTCGILLKANPVHAKYKLGVEAISSRGFPLKLASIFSMKINAESSFCIQLWLELPPENNFSKLLGAEHN